MVNGAIALSSVELGIYANSNGLPGALILDAGNVSTIATGQKNVTGLTQVLSPGWYWVAYWSSHSITCSGMGANATTAVINQGIQAITTGSQAYNHAEKTLTFSAGALPSSIISPTMSPNVFPAVALTF